MSEITGGLYCFADQIGSTRIVTDDQANMVYTAAHDPYGGVQQTWADAFAPECKYIGMGDDLNFKFHLNFKINFSDKEQDTESGLYYFGARYYDPTLYRFLTPDPIIPSDIALYNPQRWNLYGYCLGNPINLIDVNGRWGKYVHYELTFRLALEVGLPRKVAETIAKANQGVDSKFFKSGSFMPWGYRLHFPDESHLNRAYETAYTTLSPEKLGQALHTIQDFYAHLLFCHKPYFGHLFESIKGKIKGEPWNDPDYVFRDLELLSDMLAETEGILEDYRERLLDQVVSTITNFLTITIFFMI